MHPLVASRDLEIFVPADERHDGYYLSSVCSISTQAVGPHIGVGNHFNTLKVS